MVEYLSWDSDFFGKKIGKLNASQTLDEQVLKRESFGYDLVYLFSDCKINIDLNEVDVKITFLKKIDFSEDQFDIEIENFDINKHSYNDLLELVYLSGHESRFKNDKINFSDKLYRKLYKTWIDKSLNSPDTLVLVSTDIHGINGFITCSVDKIDNKIGLIAVAERSQGCGIGKKLIRTVEEYLNPDSNLFVSTQEKNVGACRFYQKNGFSINNKTYIYHYAPNTL